MTLRKLPAIAAQEIDQLDTSWPISSVTLGGSFVQHITKSTTRLERHWQIGWSYLDDEKLAELTDFFADHRGIFAFLWSPDDGQTNFHIICQNWRQTAAQGGLWHLTARFEAVLQVAGTSS